MEKCQNCEKQKSCEIIEFLGDFIQARYNLEYEKMDFECCDKVVRNGAQPEIKFSNENKYVVIEAKTLTFEFITKLNKLTKKIDEEIISLLSNQNELIEPSVRECWKNILDNEGLNIVLDESVVAIDIKNAKVVEKLAQNLIIAISQRIAEIKSDEQIEINMEIESDMINKTSLKRDFLHYEDERKPNRIMTVYVNTTEENYLQIDSSFDYYSNTYCNALIQKYVEKCMDNAVKSFSDYMDCTKILFFNNKLPNMTNTLDKSLIERYIDLIRNIYLDNKKYQCIDEIWTEYRELNERESNNFDFAVFEEGDDYYEQIIP